MSKRHTIDRKFKRNKKPRTTRTEEYIINSKYLGAEPVPPLEELTDSQLGKMYNWYAYMHTPADAREYAVDYLNSIGQKKFADAVSRVSDTSFPTTAGWICRIMHRGGKVPSRTKEFMIDRLNVAMGRVVEKIKEEVKKPPRQHVDVQANIRERARDIIGGIELLIDQGNTFSVYEYLQKNEIPATYAPYIVSYYSKMVIELDEVLTEPDHDLKEAYKNFDRSQIKEMLEFFLRLIEEAERYGSNAKKVRKIDRKPKTVSIEKLLKRFKFKKNDQEYKLVSINPQEIMSASELWTFNTKYKSLTVYRAQDLGGLGIKTVNITGYNASTSSTKKLRKPEETLKRVLEGSKASLKKLMDDLKTKPGRLNGRISTDTILLRVIK